MSPIAPPAKKPTPQLSDDSKRITKLLRDSIRSWKPNIKFAPSKWTPEIDKMLRIDKRSPITVANIIAWLPSHTNGTFKWRNQILSGHKLREQFDRLEIAMNESKPDHASQSDRVKHLVTEYMLTPIHLDSDRSRFLKQHKPQLSELEFAQLKAALR